MNLNETSKNKHHFILKDFQRTVGVVLTLSYFSNTYMATNQNKNKKLYMWLPTLETSF